VSRTRILVGVIVGSVTVAIGAIVYGVLDATHPDPVYGPVENYTISRRPDADGNDRIWITAAVHKLANCDLESGDGPPWVDFYDDDDGGIPPPSAFYRPDGMPTGNTLGNAGARVIMRGYSAIVPNKMKDSGGTFIVRVPCQLWAPKGEEREWGRKVVGTWGPAPVPRPGQVVESRPVLTLVAPGEAK
jgi:hypothetical protein